MDAVLAKAMGFEPMGLGLLSYAHDLGIGITDLDRIDILGSPLETVSREFKPHETNDLQLQWQDQEADRFLSV